MSHDNSDPTTQELTRRTVLRGAAGAAAAGVALGSAGTTAAQSSAYGGWFDNVDNFDGTVDKTGQSEVTVSVGASGNGGSFAFGPAAVRVDPGTTVTWEWTGKGGSHNVVAEDGSFESELVGESGHTFSHTFESDGVFKYACVPHKPMGMKGAVVVGDVDVGGSQESDSSGESSGSSGPDFGGWFDDVGNFDGVVDETGKSEVTVSVGAEGNNGAFAFDPAAVRVDPGTTVTWKWSGAGGSHNVVAEDGSFESELVGESGHTFSHTFESAGTTKYACVPHKPMGMKGAVVVSGEGGDGAGGADGGSGEGSGFRDGLTLGAGLGLVGVLLTTFVFGTKNETRSARRTQ